ncbi:MAG: TonB-dependent receptor [Aphanizomenon flos-aquae LD13]|jgi:vitamin B12 transporter|uniref:TonB-dependent receptor n=1 Tax=Aphanizomenon flos-aquae LD13 TaxID=1710894 RepID=A0A1B7W0P9_APHFL|nr:TonB-dependent receptor [Aphanizomenon flos-aquae UKL13-PB]OBQ26815.1 MAG: TonB-dependent receptor [Aphanizomenon flos-aquae LD13]QSV66501.1 MAG: TonB-dependent receptor [Aphanizomenon flos-aquae DEX188]HCQ20828.1 TonB-dependent receptor [Anabaena sp. UBA12330]
MSTNLVVKLGIQIIASSLTMTLGIWGRNCKVTAVEIPQYKENVSNKITQNTSADTKEKEADIEINVIEELLNEPVFSPFRQEGTVKDSTRPIYVITGEEMEAQGARTVREAIKFLPGILGDGTVGTEVNALSGQLIRGSNTGQVLILLDGRPINNAGSGGFDLSEFTTNNIQRIEVLPGGGSTLYGSDAIGGVINIITRRPTEKITTEAKVNIGAYGLNQQSIQNSGKKGDISWVVGYNRTQAENNYPFSIPEANFSGTRKNNDALYNNFNLKLEADLGKRNTLSFSTLYLNKEQGTPGGVSIPFPVNGQGFFNSLTDKNRKYTDQILTDLTWNLKLGGGDDSLLTAKVYGDFLNTRFDPSGSVSSQNRFQTNQSSYGIQTTHSWNFAKNQSLVYGFDYRTVNVRNTSFSYSTNKETLNYDNDINQGALFTKYEVVLIPNLTVNVGLRQDFSSLVNGSVTSPSVGTKYAVSDSTTLRANYIQNFRVPTIANLFNVNPSNIGNPELKPERGDSFDIGIDQKLGNIGLARLTFFKNNVSDTIAFKRLTPPVNSNTGTWENIGLVETTGIEATLNLQVAKNIYTFVNYTANDPRIFKSSNAAEINKELRFAGADKLNLGVSYETPQGLYLGLLMNSLNGYPTNNTNTEFLSGYTTFDFKLLVPLSDKLVVTGSVENLFNQRYQLFPGFPDGGRGFQIGLSSTF